MPSFGETLQREREMRGISLEEISAATKISTRNLRALEEEKFDQLPGGIFNKGFVRSYARFLGIDEERVVGDYISAENEFRRKRVKDAVDSGIVPAEELLAVAPQEAEPAAKHSSAFRSTAVVLVLLLVIGAGSWLWLGSRAKVSQVRTQASARQSQTAPTTAQPSAAVESAPDTAKVSAAESATGEKKEDRKSQAEAASIPENTAGDRLSLHLRAKQDSWVQVTADGKVLLEAVLASGTDRSFEASKKFVVKLGNAAGVEVSYNGKTLPSFSPDDRVKVLTFPAAGVVNP
jgi:cytoskeleton protein RodZ